MANFVLSEKAIRRLEQMLREVKLLQGRYRDLFRRRGGGEVSRVRRAKTTAAWTEGETTTANILDVDGNEIASGDFSGVTVNFFKEYSANNFPAISDDETIPIFRDIDGKWYCPYSFVTMTGGGEGEGVDVIVEVNVDGGSNKIRTKSRTIKILEAEAVGGYDDVHTGTEC